MRTLAAVCLMMVLASSASGVIVMDIVEVDNSAVAELNGYVTQDLVATTDSDWLSAQMIITLDAPGGFYQDALGNTNPQSPNPAFFPIAASLEFDTYVANGVLGESVSVTGAVDLGGPANEIFDADHVSILWYTTGTEDIGVLPLARLSIADTATGTWELVATASPQGGPRAVAGGPVIDGLLVPEPATLGLVTLGGLAMLRRRRR